MKSPGSAHEMDVALLTGGSDKPYVLGLTAELLSKGVSLDVIGSDELACAELRDKPGLNFLNLRGDQRSNASFTAKMLRVIRYYAKLIGYAATAKPKIFHVLWNNKFETFDRTLLMLYYRFLGKRVVLTAHNVNADKRDSKDTFVNRLTLRIQYRLADAVFVHTQKAKIELLNAFGVKESRVTVIPFGINNTLPNTHLTPSQAKEQLGLGNGDRAILFFGRITPYKGLEYLVAALRILWARNNAYRLIVAGRPDNCESYWNTVRESIREDVQSGRIMLKSEFIPDEAVEIYFKAADVLVLPYRQIYQSGVLFLAYSFGLPVLAADVGSLKDEIVEGKSGLVFKAEDAGELAVTIERYFGSDLYADLATRRQQIRHFAVEQYSWDLVGQKSVGTYANLLRIPHGKSSEQGEPQPRSTSTLRDETIDKSVAGKGPDPNYQSTR